MRVSSGASPSTRAARGRLQKRCGVARSPRDAFPLNFRDNLNWVINFLGLSLNNLLFDYFLLCQEVSAVDLLQLIITNDQHLWFIYAVTNAAVLSASILFH